MLNKKLKKMNVQTFPITMTSGLIDLTKRVTEVQLPSNCKVDLFGKLRKDFENLYLQSLANLGNALPDLYFVMVGNNAEHFLHVYGDDIPEDIEDVISKHFSIKKNLLDGLRRTEYVYVFDYANCRIVEIPQNVFDNASITADPGMETEVALDALGFRIDDCYVMFSQHKLEIEQYSLT